MARGCCGSQCACKLDAGTGVNITGTGTQQDPFIISADANLTVTDTTALNLTLTGDGSVGTPWAISGTFAATSAIDMLGDVNAPTPSNADVLGWDSATSKWTPRAPTTAASGSVDHDTSLDGDGSPGTPLQVNEDPNGRLVTTASGLGVNDQTKNELIIHYADAAARTADTLTRDVNALTALDTAPGEPDYWDGSAWQPLKLVTDVVGTEFHSLSGAYDGRPVQIFVKQVSGSTDVSGVITALDATDLTGYAGILSLTIQPTSGVWAGVAGWATDHTTVTAYRLDTGGVLASTAIGFTATAILY